jgi:hypothetical protein
VSGPREFDLLMPFDTDEREFTRGFQMGMVWALSEPAPTTSVMVYAVNAELLVRMKERGCRFACREANDDWLEIEFDVGVWE